MKYYGCDTETYNSPSFGLKSIQLVGENKEWYFTADNYDEDDNVIRFNICQKFFNVINSFNESSTVFFFNLNFDLSQIIKAMLHYWKYIPSRETERGKVPINCFSVLESDRQVFKVYIRNKRNKGINFIDIANFLTSTNLNNACKDWIGKGKVTIDSKDFDKCEPNPVERMYSIEDARLTYKLGLSLVENDVITSTSITIAGRTMQQFKQFLYNTYTLKFNEWCSTEDSEQFEGTMRKCVRGGICQAIHKGVYEHCTHIDARSMYPTQMAKPYIPLGPIYNEKPEGMSIKLIFPQGFFELKEDKIPYMQWRTKDMCTQYSHLKVYSPGEYVNDFYLDGTYLLWEPEWDIIQQCYNTDVEIVDIKYIKLYPNIALKNYVDELYIGKLTSTGTKRYYYKILLNSLYGKFLTRPDGVSVTYENGIREEIADKDRKTYYLPLGSWIAMGGRIDLMKCMLSLPYENVLYCDTDSCIFIGDKFPNVNIGKQLGDWGIENEDFTANIIGPKTYQELNRDGSVITKCAGLSNDIRVGLKFGDLYEGATFPVLKAKRDVDSMAINLVKTMFTVDSSPQILRRIL